MICDLFARLLDCIRASFIKGLIFQCSRSSEVRRCPKLLVMSGIDISLLVFGQCRKLVVLAQASCRTEVEKRSFLNPYAL